MGGYVKHAYAPSVHFTFLACLVPAALPIRPPDATLSVTKAARLLGVHPNTIRAWSDAGRLRYYRINPRGDRRYRLGDLQRFLAAAESGLPDGASADLPPRRGRGRHRGAAASLARLAANVEAGGPPAPVEAADAAAVGSRHGIDLDLLVALARIASSGNVAGVALGDAATAILGHGPHRAVAIFELRG